jgi:hypothetical protein
MSMQNTDPVFQAEVKTVREAVKIAPGSAFQGLYFQGKFAEFFAELARVTAHKNIMLVSGKVGMVKEIQEVGFHASRTKAAEDVQDFDFIGHDSNLSSTAL